MAAAIIVAVLLFYKEFKALIFDAHFLQSLGIRARVVDLILMGLIVLTVMVGLQAVGVVLIAAMLITPAVAARFWTDRLHTMVVVAATIGGVAGVAGTLVSSLAPRIPTGPVMVLAATAAFVCSAVLAPRRGLLAHWRRRRQNARRESRQHLLRAWMELGEAQGEISSLEVEKLASQLSWTSRETARQLRRLRRQGLATRVEGRWELTSEGRAQGEFVLKSHRLWEHYLVYRDILATDHVDRPADEVEHLLTPQILAQLEELLQRDQVVTGAAVGDIHASGSGYRRAGQEDAP
jgi:manganese/zinc/iron transport system permease protein